MIRQQKMLFFLSSVALSTFVPQHYTNRIIQVYNGIRLDWMNVNLGDSLFEEVVHIFRMHVAVNRGTRVEAKFRVE